MRFKLVSTPEVDFEGRKRINSDLNLAPLVDVVFILLIFFMLTSTLIKERALEVSLPASQSGQLEELEQISITVSKDGVTSIEGEILDEPQLKARLEQEVSKNPERPISLRVDKDTSFDQFVSVMDLVKTVGFQSISIVTVPDRKQ